MSAPDPFSWDTNDEDEVSAHCECGWSAPWRDFIGDVRLDEDQHDCDRSVAWREADR